MKFLQFVSVATALVISSSLNAAIISTDWQTSGDNHVTQDNVNGLEWLDLTVTRNMSYDDVIAELGVGGSLYGWRYANFGAITGCFDEFGGDSNYYDGIYAQNYAVVNAILPYWGELYCSDPGYTCFTDEQGATFIHNYDEFDYVNVQRGAIYVNPAFYGNQGQIDINNFTLGGETEFVSSSIGSALVRGINSVPVQLQSGYLLQGSLAW